MAIQDVPGMQDPAETSTAKIKTTASDGWHATVELYGEIDIAAAPALRTELDRHLDAGRWCIRIDLAGVTFFDAAGLNALVSGAERCANAQGALILTNVPARVRRIIRITGLETVLLIDRPMTIGRPAPELANNRDEPSPLATSDRGTNALEENRHDVFARGPAEPMGMGR